MPIIRLNNGREVGDGCIPLFIAEGGNNHQGEMKLAKKLIDMATFCSADCIKFQKRSVADMMTRAMRDQPYSGRNAFAPTYGAHREALEMSAEQWREMKAYADAREIMFTGSAWDAPSVDLLDSLDVPFFKVASADLTNWPLLEYTASKGRPMFLSTGMDTFDTIQLVVERLEARGDACPPLVIMHCVSVYPADPSLLNLRCITTLKRMFPQHVIGYSGHENGIAATVAAVALGACVVERHITTDRQLPGSDHAASLEIDGLRRCVRDVHIVPTWLGSEHKAQLIDGAVASKKKLGKSVTSTRALTAGHVLARADVTTKSPGDGISALCMDDMLGKTLARDVDADCTLYEADFVM